MTRCPLSHTSATCYVCLQCVSAASKKITSSGGPAPKKYAPSARRACPGLGKRIPREWSPCVPPSQCFAPNSAVENASQEVSKCRPTWPCARAAIICMPVIHRKLKSRVMRGTFKVCPHWNRVHARCHRRVYKNQDPSDIHHIL